MMVYMYVLMFMRVLILAVWWAAAAVAASGAPRAWRADGDGAGRCDSVCVRVADEAAGRRPVVCDDTELRVPGLELRALVERRFAEHYCVGLSAARTWRPLQLYGDTDAKLRVFNPTVGLAVRYNF